MAWDFSIEPEFQEKLAWMRTFVREEILPLEVLDLDHRTYLALAAPLKERVKSEGLWAAHLGPDHGGPGVGQVKLGQMHEILGACELAPPIFGNQAPDSGNCELIAIAGNEQQKRDWMWPLLEGKLLSAFSMTEVGTGSDPTQLTTAAVRDGDEYVINGTKWFITNGERADFHIVMALTSPEAERHKRYSMIIVPRHASGVDVRVFGVMSDPDGKHPVHEECEVFYRDVRVPVENLLGGEGDGFALAQKRLGPGRIHHCMRWIGVSNRAFDMLCERVVSKSVHGGLLAEKQMVQDWVALSAAEIASFRLLVLHAAWMIDQVGAPAARNEIAMIKYHGATMMQNVLDRAIQAYGSLGFSCDMPLEQMYRWARASRLYDGPDEVHKVAVARRILKGYAPADTPTEHIPTRRAAALIKYGAALEAAKQAR